MSLRYFSSDSEWESCRPLITKLRQTPGMTLKQIQARIESHCGFRATEKMYKKKFEKWALGKNNRRADIEAILRRKAQRDAAGKSTYFFLRGRLVRLADVDKYAKRNKISLDTLQPLEENENDDLKDLICCTPPPASSMLQPERYRETEKFFHSFFNFTLEHLDELVAKSTSSLDAVISRYNESMQATVKLSGALCFGADRYRQGKVDLAGIYWRKGFAELYTSIKDSQPEFMLEILLAARDLSKAGCPEIGIMLRKHASQIADAQLGANHPRLLAYGSMAAVEECDIHIILLLAGKLHRRVVAERSEESPNLMWNSRLWVAGLLSRLGDDIITTEYLSLLSEMEKLLGKSHSQVLAVLLEFGKALIRMPRDEDALAIFLEFLERVPKNGPDNMLWKFHGLLRLEDAQYTRGNIEDARTTFISALSTFQRSQPEILHFTGLLNVAYSFLEGIVKETAWQ